MQKEVLHFSLLAQTLNFWGGKEVVKNLCLFTTHEINYNAVSLDEKKLLILLSKHEKIYYLFCFNKKKLVDVGKVDLESRKNLIRKFGVHKNKLIS